MDDPKQRQPDITRARKLLGWEPKIDLDDGLAKPSPTSRTCSTRAWCSDARERIDPGGLGELPILHQVDALTGRRYSLNLGLCPKNRAGFW